MYFKKKILSVVKLTKSLKFLKECIKKNIHVDWLHNLHPISQSTDSFLLIALTFSEDGFEIIFLASLKPLFEPSLKT